MDLSPRRTGDTGARIPWILSASVQRPHDRWPHVSLLRWAAVPSHSRYGRHHAAWHRPGEVLPLASQPHWLSPRAVWLLQRGSPRAPEDPGDPTHAHASVEAGAQARGSLCLGRFPPVARARDNNGDAEDGHGTDSAGASCAWSVPSAVYDAVEGSHWWRVAGSHADAAIEGVGPYLWSGLILDWWLNVAFAGKRCRTPWSLNRSFSLLPR